MAETMTKKPAKIPPAIPNVGGQGHTATALAIESALVQAVGARQALPFLYLWSLRRRSSAPSARMKLIL